MHLQLALLLYVWRVELGHAGLVASCPASCEWAARPNTLAPQHNCGAAATCEAHGSWAA
jgi:hypothetical protein